MTLAQRDLDRLNPTTRAVWETLAGLRDGKVMEQFAEVVVDVVNAVIQHHTVNDQGKVGGPTGSVTLTLTISPHENDPEGLVNITDKLASKRPEDRTHPVYVGKGGTVHVRDPRGLDRHKQLTLVDASDVVPSLDPEVPPAAPTTRPEGVASPFTVTADEDDRDEGDGNRQYPD